MPHAPRPPAPAAALVRATSALLELLDSAVLVHDLTPRLVGWSRGAAVLYGLTAAEAEGQPAPALLHSEYPVPAEAVWEQVRATGSWTGRVRQRSRRGEPLTVISRIRLQRDAAGAPVALWETVEVCPAPPAPGTRALQRVAQALAPLLAEAPAAVVFLDRAGLVQAWNPAAEACFGRRASDLLGHSLPSGWAAEAVVETMRDAGALATPQTALARQGDGALRVWAAPLRDRSGALLGTLGVFLDVTDLQRTEGLLSERTRHLEAIRAVAAELTRELDLPRLLQLIVDRAVALCRATRGAIRLWEPASQRLVPQAWTGDPTPIQTYAFALGEGVAGTAAQRRVGLRVADFRTSPFATPALLAISTHHAVLAEPLLYHDELIGVVTLAREAPDQPFTAADQELLRLLADQAALAIINARLHQGALRRSAELEAILKATHLIETSVDLDTRLHAIVQQALAISGAAAGRLLLLDAAGRVLQARAGLGPDGRPEAPFSLPATESFAGEVVRTRRPLVVPDIRTDPRVYYPEHVRQDGHVSYLGLPVTVHGRLLGVLVLNTIAPHTYAPDAIELLQLFADQAAIALENARLFQEERARRMELEAIRTVTAELTRELDLPALLRLIHDRAIALAGGDSGLVWRWEAATQCLCPERWPGLGAWAKDLIVPLGEGVSGRVAVERKGRCVNDYKSSPDAWAPFLARTTIVHALIEPLCYRDQLVGVLSVHRDDPARPFTADDQRVVRLFADQAAIALENAHLFQAQQAAYAQLEQAQEEHVRTEKLRALGQLAAGVAHDLNNTLAAILGQAELLQLRVALPEVQAALQVLTTAAADGAQVVRRLQEFSRRRPTAPQGSCDLAAIMEEALALTRPRWEGEAQRQGRCIRVRTVLDGLPPIPGDPAELREVFINLLLNAVDAMPAGGVLTLAAEPTPVSAAPERPAGVSVTVRDTGTGMSEAVRHRVFDPFFTTKGVQGTGLGLAVAYSIVERHGGRIAVASALGEGTAFTLWFPAAPSARSEARPSPAPDPPARRLLFIDDEPAVRATTAALLRAGGHTVVEAASGPAGLAALATHPVDLVLTDLGMPEMTGWEVARQVKAAFPRLPVLLLTGWGEQLGDPSATPGEVDRILTKPARLDELQAAIAELTRRPARPPAADPGGAAPGSV